ncbi:MAG: hypothetical protein ABI790_07725 [Betaproteobacteria bacterium]
MKATFSFARKALVVAVAAGICGSASAAVTDRVYFSAAPLVLVWGTDASGNPAVVSDFVLVNTASGTAGTDLTAASVIPVITGSMTAVPTAPSGNSLFAVTNPAAAPAGGGVLTDAGTAGQLDAADTYTAFGLGATTGLGFAAAPQSHSFYVASNSAFDIFAQAGAAAYTGNFSGANVPLTAISWAMSISAAATTDSGVSWGGAAAQDPTTGGTGVIAATNLSSFAAATKVFDGGRRTAAAAGTILAQSVRFSVQYGLNYDLSMGSGSVSVPVTYTVYTP